MGWTIVYEDGTRFSSEDGTPYDAPCFGVLVIGQPGVDYRDLVWGEIYYIYRSDHGYWSGHDKIGLIDQLAHALPFITGFCVGRDTTNSTMKKAVADFGKEMRGK